MDFPCEAVIIYSYICVAIMLKWVPEDQLPMMAAVAEDPHLPKDILSMYSPFP